jgi:hypothetical protein
MQATPPQENQQTLFCVNHPHVKTLLRCNRCGDPVCLACVEHTAVGYRCKRCICEQQSIYFNNQPQDGPLALAVAFAITVITIPLAGIVLRSFLGWGIPAAFVTSASAGKALAELVQRAIGRRRGRHRHWWVTAGVAVGILVASLILYFISATALLSEISLWLFVLLAAVTTNRELR